MIMLGLGGEAFSQEHALETAKLLNSIKAKYITFLTVTTEESTPYAVELRREVDTGVNRPLTNTEIVQQLRLLIQHLDPRGQKIGMFGEETHSAGSNPIVFRTDFDQSGKREIIEQCNLYIRTSKRAPDNEEHVHGVSEAKRIQEALRSMLVGLFRR